MANPHGACCAGEVNEHPTVKQQAGQENHVVDELPKVNALPCTGTAAKNLRTKASAAGASLTLEIYIESAETCCSQPEADMGVMQQAGGTSDYTSLCQ